MRYFYIGCLAFALLARGEDKPVYSLPDATSPRHYSLHGELSFTFFKGVIEAHTEKLKCEVLRDGDYLKITTSDYDSTFPASVFLCDGSNAFTYVQYRAEDASNDAPGPETPWNNASVYVSIYRMPSYVIGKLTPLWLMAQAQAERVRGNPNGAWPTVFGSWVSFDFFDQPKVVPETLVENFWPDGFAHFVESFEFPDPEDGVAIFQEETFNIVGWTNCDGAIFPASFFASVKKERKREGREKRLISEARFSFVTDTIEPAPAISPEVRGPRCSQVQDMRPFERGDLTNGFSYRSTNGIIYLDPLTERKEHGLRLVPVFVKAMKPGGPRVGAIAPDFDINTLDGETLKFANLRGKYVLLDFWATDCPPCIGEIADLKATYVEFAKDDRFLMVGLSLDSNRQRLVKFVKDKDVRWPQALLAEGFTNPIAQTYGVDAIPSIFLIGPDGKCIFCGIGGHGIKHVIAKALASK